MIGNTLADINTLDTDVLFSLNNFWRFLDLPLINCEKELDFSLSKMWIKSEILRTAAIVANAAANPPVLAEPATSTFQINNTKL